MDDETKEKIVSELERFIRNHDVKIQQNGRQLEVTKFEEVSILSLDEATLYHGDNYSFSGRICVMCKVDNEDQKSAQGIFKGTAKINIIKQGADDIINIKIEAPITIKKQ